MSGLPLRRGATRILDFDIESRPLTYWTPDRPTAEITAIAWAWVDDPFTSYCVLLGRDDPKRMLETFVQAYDEASCVTGHYIRKFDLPQIQAALAEYGLPRLGSKLAHDTKLDLITWGDMPKTQEHLAEMMGVSSPKVHMTQADWREANRLTPEGLAKTEKRVAGDVRQHMELRVALLKRGLLGAPKVWRG